MSHIKPKRFPRTPARSNENQPPIKRKYSDSEESTDSSASADDFAFRFEYILEVNRQHRAAVAETHSSYLDALGQFREFFQEHNRVLTHLKLLQSNVEQKSGEVEELEEKLEKARKYIDEEKNLTRRARRERDALVKQVAQVKELLGGKTSQISDEVRHKLSILSNQFIRQERSSNCINSTGSILSDLSYSKSEDDILIDESKGWNKHRPSAEGVAEPPNKKRRSSGVQPVQPQVEANDFKETNGKDVQVVDLNEDEPNLQQATSPEPAQKDPTRNVHDRPHQFQTKTIVMPETCHICSKRIRFGSRIVKCKTCKTICHTECKDLVPLPCAPQPHTPKHGSGNLRDYTPNIPPMVPPLLIHCIKEIENRGLDEVGLYRVSGAERDVRSLKDKLLKGKITPQMGSIDIHAVCSTVKDFLRGLEEPLVPRSMWHRFVAVLEGPEHLKTVVEAMPRPNRDTMAYLVLHLQKVAQNTNAKMNIENLSKIFGITVVGYSSKETTAENLMREVVLVTKVMEELLRIEREYWENFLEQHLEQPRLMPTSSTDSLLRSVGNKEYSTPKRLNNQPKFFANLIMS